MQLTKINKRIYSIEFDTTTVMCHTLVRFSEYYENPHFKGRIFTKKEFRDWYVASKGRKINTYSRDWCGFNIPGEIIQKFRDFKIDSLERRFLNLFTHLTDKQLKTIYVICTAKDSAPTTFKHELCHALQDTISSYDSKINKIYTEFDPELKEKINKWFKKVGYNESVWVSEFNAYITEDYKDFERNVKLPKNSLKELAGTLEALYNAHKIEQI